MKERSLAPVANGMSRSAAFGKRPYGPILLLNAGMVLMFLGFFAFIGGESESVSVGVTLAGVACELLGFFLAYLGYRAAVATTKAPSLSYD